MKLAWLAAAGLVAFAAPAFAQAPSAPPPAAADAPVDPERLALARQMLTVFDAKAAMHSMFASMADSMQMPPNAPPEQQEKARRLITSIFAGVEAETPALMDEMAKVYARVLTVQEMRDALAFYHTPSGQALLSKLPAINREIMPVTFRLMPRILESAKKDYCAQGCDKTDEAMFAAVSQMYGVKPAS